MRQGHPQRRPGRIPSGSPRPEHSTLTDMEAPAAAAPPSSIQALPIELLQRCLALLPPAGKLAAFRTCKQFARAVLLATLHQEKLARLRWREDRAEPFSPSAKLLQQLVGPQDSKGVALVLHNGWNPQAIPVRCLAELRAAGVILTCVTRLKLQLLVLDSLIPDGLSTLLPNLRQLCVDNCTLTAAAADSLVDTACGKLQHVEVWGLGGGAALCTTQLFQLAGLPSLTSFTLMDASCPTLFLNALGSRLATLNLAAAFRRLEPGTQSLRSSWRATLQHVARCTALQSLAIPCGTAEELGAVAPALQQLRRLRLNGGARPAAATDGDAVVELLLGLPHLTSLHWENVGNYTFQRSFAISPCHWQELTCGPVSVGALACLPLHSLAAPVVVCGTLSVDERTSLADVQAAACNVARGFQWKVPAGSPHVSFKRQPDGGAFARGAAEGDTPAALLRALGPLLAAAGLELLRLDGLAWDAELAQALGQALPHPCKRLLLATVSITLPACMQLAWSVPWLEEALLASMRVHPHAVTAYVAAAASAPEARLQGARPRLRRLLIQRPVRQEGVAVEAHRRDWEEARLAVAGMQAGVELSVAL